jgi:tetratricopeptide (TPR) repeat protein
MRATWLLALLLLAPAVAAAAPKDELTPQRRQELEKKAAELIAEATRLYQRGDNERTLAVSLEVLEVHRQLYPDGHPNLAYNLNFVGFLFLGQGEYARAEPFLHEALAMRRRLYPEAKYPDGQPEFANGLGALGAVLYAQGKSADAATVSGQALDMYGRLARRYADTIAEAEALNYLTSFPLPRDAFLSVTRHLPADPAAYDRVWEVRAPLARLLERRHRDLLASHDGQARDLGRQLVEARPRLAYTFLNPARDHDAQRREVEKRTEAKDELEKRLPRVEERPADRPRRSAAAHWAAFTFSGVRPPATEAAPGQ